MHHFGAREIYAVIFVVIFLLLHCIIGACNPTISILSVLATWLRPTLQNMDAGELSVFAQAKTHALLVCTCVGCQVTLCDPIWQVTPHSSEMEFR